MSIGNKAESAYQNNSVARYALDHPYQAGTAIGVAGGALVAGGVVAGGGAITCGVLCGGSAATVATGGAMLSTQANRAVGLLNNAQGSMLTAAQRQKSYKSLIILNLQIYLRICTKLKMVYQVELLELFVGLQKLGS